MRLFGRSTNPIWHEMNKLPEECQLIVGATLSTHDFMRQSVAEELVQFAIRFLGDNILGPEITKRFVHNLSSHQRERFIDEMLLATLTCSNLPEASNWRFALVSPQQFRDGIGGIAIDDVNQRTSARYPYQLNGVGYSGNWYTDLREVTNRWVEIASLPRTYSDIPIPKDNMPAGIEPTLSFALSTLLLLQFDNVCKSLFIGVTTGLNRTINEVIIDRSRHIINTLPRARVPFILAMVRSMDKLR